MAYLYDPVGKVQELLNMETLITCPVTVPHWQHQLKSLLMSHLQETDSLKAKDILQHWETEQRNFLQVCPTEMLVHLSEPLSLENDAIPAE
ncbi:MAG: hypothetical protein HOJ51_00320 [Tateyamaria sp.]|nr:hypothetical protein [Tateyamaria sp.]